MHEVKLWEVYGVNACRGLLMLCTKYNEVMVACGVYILHASVHLKPRAKREIRIKKSSLPLPCPF